MIDHQKLQVKAGKVAGSILNDPELAYYICKQLNGAKIAGPWERIPEMRMIGRLAPNPPGSLKRFVCHIEYTGSHFEWKALKDLSTPASFIGDKRPAEERMQSGKSTSMYSSMQAADRRLTDQGWILVGSPLVTDKWEGVIHRDELSRKVIPGSLRRIEAETGGQIIAIRWGDVTTMEGDEVEGLIFDSPAIEEIRGRVIEKRDNEGWNELIVRGMKLVDDTLRRLGWMVGVGED